MNDYSLNSMTHPRPEVVATRTERTDAAPAAPRQGLPGAAAETGKPARAESSDAASLPVSNMDNVSLRFRVDEKTKNITVFIVDRASKRVLRSIPPEELNKLQAGDLLELLA
jgi:hypothetical protein